jgi:hypothetical protein
MSERLERIQQNDLLRAINDISLYGPKGIRMEAVIKDIEWLIQQAERVQELEQVIGDLDENVAAFETLWLEEKRKNQRYKQALEFYADEETYEPLEVQIGAVTKEGYKISKYKYDPIINTDKGKKARETLGWEEGK